MTTKLSDELRQAIDREGGRPILLIDAVTNVEYVLMRSEQYENLKALFIEGEEFNPRELYLRVSHFLADRFRNVMLFTIYYLTIDYR
jgi:hypothetical protein